MDLLSFIDAPIGADP